MECPRDKKKDGAIARGRSLRHFGQSVFQYYLENKFETHELARTRFGSEWRSRLASWLELDSARSGSRVPNGPSEPDF